MPKARTQASEAETRPRAHPQTRHDADPAPGRVWVQSWRMRRQHSAERADTGLYAGVGAGTGLYVETSPVPGASSGGAGADSACSDVASAQCSAGMSPFVWADVAADDACAVVGAGAAAVAADVAANG